MITLTQAKTAIEQAEMKAKEIGVAVSITIVDTAGTLIASHRMDGAIAISPEFSYIKAFTSASLGIPSMGLSDYAQPGKPYYGVNTVMGGKLTPIAGGQPIMIAGKLVGGVGVGGSMDVSQDDAVATMAMSTFA